MKSIRIKASTLIAMLINLYIFIITTSVNTGTLPVKIVRVVLALALFFYIFQSGGLKINSYVIWAILFLAYNVVMIRYAAYRSYAREYTRSLFFVLIINIGFCLFIRNHNITEGMIKTFLFSTIVKAALTFGQNGLLIFMTTRKTDEGSANLLGFYSAMAFVLCLIMRDKTKDKLYTIVCFFCLLISFLTASRKVLVYIFVPLMFYWILSSNNPIKTLRNTVLAAIVLGSAFYALMHIDFAYRLLGSRIESMINGFLGLNTDSSTSTRLRLIRAGMAWFKERPWFGYGVANFSALNWVFRGSVYYAHNNYVELLVDCGIIGTAIYYWLYLHLIVRTVKSRDLERKSKSIVIGLLACFIIGDWGMVSYNLAIFQLLLMNLYMVATNRIAVGDSLRGGPTKQVPQIAVEGVQ